MSSSNDCHFLPFLNPDFPLQVGHLEGIMDCLHQCFHDDEVWRESMIMICAVGICNQRPRLRNHMSEYVWSRDDNSNQDCVTLDSQDNTPHDTMSSLKSFFQLHEQQLIEKRRKLPEKQRIAELEQEHACLHTCHHMYPH